MTTSSFIESMRSHGYRAAVVPYHRLDDLERELRELGDAGFVTRFIGWRANGLDELRPKGLPFDVRSVAIIAKASPAARVRIETGTAELDVIVPPTYLDADAFEADAARDASAILAPSGLHAAPANDLPYKLLAVRSGLGRYGRNNICYVDGLGSYLNLFALYLDLPTERDPWRDARRMDACDSCTACVAACPTQVIDKVRTVIDSDRCLCWVNERKDPFPDDLDPKVHHTLVGCLRCQQCCPVNAVNRDNVQYAGVLSEDAVRQILALQGDERPTQDVIDRAEAIGMAHYKEQLQRNLKALIEAQT